MNFAPFEALALAGSLAFLVFIFLERIALEHARSKIGFVIHVNGTRGKTETTRLTAAALRASGIRTLAKTTGTLPRLIMPDGSERPFFRCGAPNVREQRRLVFLAARMGVDALVVECMAVSEDAQAASTAFLTPDLLVATNARLDHVAELGSPEEAAAVFARGIPAGGRVVTADPRLGAALEPEALKRGAVFVLAAPLEGAGSVFPENAGAALAAALAAGARSEEAIAGMRSHTPDLGAYALRALEREGGGIVYVADALAANDPLSTGLILGKALASIAGTGGPSRLALLLATRADRPDRSLAFAEWVARGMAARRAASASAGGGAGPADGDVAARQAEISRGDVVRAAASEWGGLNPKPPHRIMPDASCAYAFDEILVVGPLPRGPAMVLARGFSSNPEEPAGKIERHKTMSEAIAALRKLPEGCLVLAAGNWKGFGPALAAAAPPIRASVAAKAGFFQKLAGGIRGVG